MKHLNLFFVIVILFASHAMNGQKVRISLVGQEGLVMGNMAKNEMDNPSAGYVDYASVGGLEINYYLSNNIGFGLRWSGTYYGRDTEAYESDLTDMLGIGSNPYDLSQFYGFWDLGSELGISYLLDFSTRWQLEPYFYLGFRMMMSPMSTVIYTRNTTTYQYKSKSQLYIGAAYAPGIKLHWNAMKQVGFCFSLEYEGKAFLEEEERSMVYSFNSLEITDRAKNYSIHSVYIGLGLSLRFGGGKEQ